ncbi:MAG: hypothetical protein MJ064_08905 [Lachnospiraceae bacterium]|nr:hypothetical protein [Lachnospiraceae bacterium]
MRIYKLEHLNKGFKLSREKDLAQAEEIINQMSMEGWVLQQITCPADGNGAMVGVFYQELDEQMYTDNLNTY